MRKVLTMSVYMLYLDQRVWYVYEVLGRWWWWWYATTAAADGAGAVGPYIAISIPAPGNVGWREHRDHAT